MYGLDPANIERFAHLRGGEVQQVCVGKSVSPASKGKHLDLGQMRIARASGNVADVWEEQQRSPKFCAFVDLLGATVLDVFIDDNTTLRFRFTDGRELVLLDISKQYESFQVDDVIV